MSIDSALIVKREKLPSTAELEAAIAETGVSVVFPATFALDQTGDGWVAVTVDGEKTGFGYVVEAMTDLEDPLPARARRYGDTLLSFGAKGSLSAETVSLIQRVMGARWGAAAWIEEELVTPKDLAREDGPPPEGMDPDLAATLHGTPAERAAATDRYVAKFRAPIQGTSAPDDNIKLDHGFAWKAEHTVGIVLFLLAIIAITLWNTVF